MGNLQRVRNPRAAS